MSGSFLGCTHTKYRIKGFAQAQNIVWERSGRVLDEKQKGRRFEPQRRHCVVVLEQDSFILA